VPFFTPLFVRRPLYLIIHHLFGASIFKEISFPAALAFYVIEALGVLAARRRRTPVMVVSPARRPN